jgi:hypothetical protein
MSAPGSSPTSIIPYDYAATFRLRGIPGNIVEDVINVSVEGVFVAVAIGYGFEEERARPIEILPPPPDTPDIPDTLGEITLDRIPIEALITGFRLDPRLGPTIFPDEELTPGFRKKLFQRVKPAEEISFLFSIVDSATGRELQDEPTHNLASLGKSNGERPFRLLAQPIVFQPRSTIRLQVIEQSEIQVTEDVPGPTLFIVLYGYKILAAGCPEPLVRTVRGSPDYAPEMIGTPSAQLVPFDYVARLDLTGVPKNIVEMEVPINVDGGFVATAQGYGLAVEERGVLIQSGTDKGIIEGKLINESGDAIPNKKVTLRNVALKTDTDLGLTGTAGEFSGDDLIPGEYEFLILSESDRASSKIRIISNFSNFRSFIELIFKTSQPPQVKLANINLSKLPLKLFSLNALTDGFRIRPNFLRIAFTDEGKLSTAFPVNLLDSVFEPLNRPEDVSFRYRVFDSGTGRELENQPINNIAGLGIANGDRPFKKFARPMIFLPRSTVRVTVQEHFGRGTLFFVFQGYKVLGRIAVGGRL